MKLQNFNPAMFSFFEHDRVFKARQYGFCVWLPSCLTKSELALLEDMYRYCYHPEPDAEGSPFHRIFNYWDIFCV